MLENTEGAIKIAQSVETDRVHKTKKNTTKPQTKKNKTKNTTQ